jgi:hypothetical protein
MPMDVKASQAMVRRRFAELDKKNFGVLDEMFARSYRLNLPGMPKALDLDGTKDFYHMLYTAFPVSTVSVKSCFRGGLGKALRVDRHVLGNTPQRAVEADGSRTTASCIQVAWRAELGRLIEGGLALVAWRRGPRLVRTAVLVSAKISIFCSRLACRSISVS